MKNMNRAGILLSIIISFVVPVSFADSSSYHSSGKIYSEDVSSFINFLEERELYHTFLPGELIEVPFIGEEPQGGSIFLLFPAEYWHSSLPFIEAADQLRKEGRLYNSLNIVILPGEFPETNRSDTLSFPDSRGGPGPDNRGFTPLGSSEFLRTFSPDQGLAFIYMNTPDRTSRYRIVAASSGTASPSWLLKRLLRSFSRADMDHHYLHLETTISRLDLRDYPSPLDPFTENGYPAIEVRGEGEGSTTNQEARQFLTALTALPSLPKVQDRYYQIIPFSEDVLIIEETFYILLLIILFSMTMAYPIFAGSRLKKYLRTLWRHAWSLPLLALLMFLFLFAATMLLNYLGQIKGVERLWEYYPLTMLLFKIAVGAFLFILSQRLFLMLPFSRRGSFYSASALFFLITGITVISIIDLDLTFYLLLPFISVILFTIIRSRIGKAILFILAGLPFLLALYTFFSLPAYQVIRSILLSPFTGNIIIALHLLPFLLMLIRLQYLFHHPNFKVTLIVTLGMEFFLLGIAVFTGISLLNAQPFEKRDQPLLILQEESESSMTKKVIFYSTAVLGELPFQDGKIDSNSFLLDLPKGAPPLRSELNSHTFLSRKEYTLQIEVDAPLSLLSLKILSNEPFTVLDASEEWSYGADSRIATLVIGNSPPTPYSLRFTLPATVEGSLEIEARFSHPPDPVDLGKAASRFQITRKAVYRASLELGPPEPE
jgi:hypothetical protein